MAASGSGLTGKRPMPWDLDMPIEEIVVAKQSTQPSSSSNPTSSSHKKVKPPRPDWPPIEYTQKARSIGVDFYRRRSLAMLEREYVSNNENGYHELLEKLRYEIEVTMESSEDFNNYQDYWLASEWLDKTVKALATNIVTQWRYDANKKENRTDWDVADQELFAKLSMIETFCQGFSKSRARGKLPWKESMENAVLTHCVSGTFQWLDSSVKVVQMPGFTAEGGYGTVMKVHITRLNNMPMWMDFAEKRLKEENQKKKRLEIINEAGGCPVKHPGIIRLSYLNPKTMAGYSLWWNGGSLASFWKNMDNKISEVLEIEDIVKQHDSELSKAQLEWVATYRKNRVALALSLLVTVWKCHNENYMHNDLSPSNVLLHFDPWKKNTVYIGICDWGISSRVVEKEPSKYGYDSMEKLAKVKQVKKFVAPELFYVYGSTGSENSLEVMQRRHLYSVAADTYSAGWIAQKIWNEEWDSKYFVKEKCMNYALLKTHLQSLQKEDVNDRATIGDVLETLRKPPYGWLMPECCYRR